MTTQSPLKKIRYTHLYIQLLVSRNWLPVSHSGQKVMNPESHNSQFQAMT